MGLFGLLSKKERETQVLSEAESTFSNTEAGQIARKAVFLNWCNGKVINKKDKHYYPVYFRFHYGITDIPQYHTQMLSEGYLRRSNAEEVLTSYKLPALKELLDEMELPKTGKKKDLIKRIITNATDEFLEWLSDTSDVLVLSDQGEDFVLKHIDYVQFHKKSYNFTFDEYQSAKESLSFKGSYNDIMWGLLNKRVMQDVASRYLEHLALTYYEMALILKEEGKSKEALRLFIFSLFCDLNWENMHLYPCAYLEKGETIEDVLSYPNVDKTVSFIYELRDNYEETMLDDAYRRNAPPKYKSISTETFREIINNALESGSFNLDDYKKELTELYKSNIKSEELL